MGHHAPLTRMLQCYGKPRQGLVVPVLRIAAKACRGYVSRSLQYTTSRNSIFPAIKLAHTPKGWNQMT